MTDEIFVKALKQQQEAHNDALKRQSDYNELVFCDKTAIEAAYKEGVQEA